MSIVSNSAATMAQKTQGSLLLLKGGLIAVGAAAVGFIKKTGMIAAEYSTLNITMQQIATNVANQAGADAERFVGYINDVRAGLKGISPIEATEAVTTFLRAELPIERLNELSEAAKNFGVTVSDMSSSQVLGRFIEVITSGNTSLLKGIGIMKTVNQMYIEYGKTIGKIPKKLSQMEKQAAIIEGILGQVSLSAGVYEKAMESAGKQMSSFSRHTQTAAVTIGSRFEPILAKAIFTANNFLKWFNALPDSVMDSIANVIKFVAAAGSLVLASRTNSILK